MRLLTRADFDGLACAALLKDIGEVDDFKFIHPKDVQDGRVEVTENDILANVPYVEGVGLWFDHHTSEQERMVKQENFEFNGVSRPAPSCARVIYDYFGGGWKFGKFDDSGLMTAVDKADSGDFTREEVLRPSGWVLLALIMDPRTGLERLPGYRIGITELTLKLLDMVGEQGIDQILLDPDVRERVDRYFNNEAAYKEMVTKHSRVDENVLIMDLRDVGDLSPGNRFIEYALFTKINVSIRVLWGKEQKNVVFTVGHSIINRTCRSDVGSLLLKYGGGGHRKVGTAQVRIEEAARAFVDILTRLKNAG